MDDVVQRFLQAWDDFYMTVVSNVGYSDEQFEALQNALIALKPQVTATRTVPIQVANVFIDLFSALESQTYRHDAVIAQKIRYAADQLAACARDVTYTPDNDLG